MPNKAGFGIWLVPNKAGLGKWLVPNKAGLGIWVVPNKAGWIREMANAYEADLGTPN